MGAVYRAYDEQAGRTVAVKVVTAHAAAWANLEARKRLRREAKILARMQHPNVVRLFDFIPGDDGDYIVMEYVDGVTLDDWVAAVKPTVAVSVEMVAALADALAEVHGQGVLHRDIKPANILVDGDGRARLVDFGLGCGLDDGTLSRMTETGMVVGTPQYMPPEIFLTGKRTEQSDVYQLGLVLFELVTGTDALGLDDFNALLRGAFGGVPAPSTVAPAVPATLDEVVLRATALRVEDRYPDARRFADACRRWLDGRGTDAVSAASDTIDTRPLPIDDDDSTDGRPRRIGPIGVLVLALCCLALGWVVRSWRSTMPSATNVRVERSGDTVTVTFRCPSRPSVPWSVHRVATMDRTIASGRSTSTDGGHVVVLRGLPGGAAYELVLAAVRQEAPIRFETLLPQLVPPTRARLLGRRFLLQFQVSPAVPLVLELEGDGLHRVDVARDATSVLVIDAPSPGAAGLAWRLAGAGRTLAAGVVADVRAYEASVLERLGLEGRLVDDVRWIGRRLYLIDRRGALVEAIVDSTGAPDDEQAVRAGRRWFLGADGTETHAFSSVSLVPTGATLFAVAVGSRHAAVAAIDTAAASTTFVRRHAVDLGHPFSLEVRPCRFASGLVLGGHAWDSTAWLGVDVETGRLFGRWILPRKRGSVPATEPPRSVVELDTGTSFAAHYGYGLVSTMAPFQDGVVCGIIDGDGGREFADGAIVALRRPSDEVGHGTSPLPVTTIATTSVPMAILPLTPLGADGYAYPTCDGYVALRRDGRHERLVTVPERLPGRSPGYVASGLAVRDSVHYFVRFEQDFHDDDAMVTMVRPRRCHLARWTTTDGVVVLDPPLFKEPTGVDVVPHVVELVLVRDRYLVGVTTLSVFAVDLQDGRAGTVSFGDTVIRAHAVDERGWCALVLKKGAVSLLPLELVLGFNPVTLAKPPASGR